ncbi:hypothetical protein I6N90_21795 [Paenibacillus sp. GSMTC-2017]|uniref:hypothetical protein n=1 Tax=Paenibacillus sp. GSMTC-2017 TaxID=2794350 RepID=UPI0018D64C17|nr:hypothetical protein [Paenibacillus sp. GSMTC-2017]MBH5320431.1 hypothetical protein [Paenibacillus sp. GSMTC-2017]
MKLEEYVLISAPNEAGRSFLKALLMRGIPVVGLANTIEQLEYMRELGLVYTIMVMQGDEHKCVLPPVPIGKVYLFEQSLPALCQYLLVCRVWTSKSIFIIKSVADRISNAPSIYRQLGANHVLLSTGNDMNFLLGSELREDPASIRLAH